MIAKVSLAAGLVLMAATLAPTGVSAAMAPQSPMPGVTIEGSLVQKAQWGYCHGWRRECAARWGWRTASSAAWAGTAAEEWCQTLRV